MILALQVVFVAIGACGIRLVCLFLQLTGLNRFVGASYGTQQRINMAVEEALIAYRRDETARLAQDMAPQDITVTQKENVRDVHMLSRHDHFADQALGGCLAHLKGELIQIIPKQFLSKREDVTLVPVSR